MKRYLYILLLFPIIIIGQTGNFIKSTSYKHASTSTIANPTTGQASQGITYLDGLGRPIQQITNAHSPLGKDIVVPILYDDFGRQIKEYLPYTSSQNNMAAIDNTVVIAGLTNQYQLFYKEGNPYSEKEFETSPLNRILKQAAPGEDWKLGNGHELRFDYKSNSYADQVRRFDVSFIGGNTEDPYLEDNGVYARSQLSKTITKDENWQENQIDPNDHTTEEFKDKEGRVILKRNFDAGKWHDTYYVYDIYGNLTYVLPPKVATYSNLGQVFQKQEIFLDNYNDGASFLADNSYYSEISMYESKGKLECYFYGENFQNEIVKSGKIADLNFTPDLPDMTLGDIIMYNSSGQPIVAGTAYIQQGDLGFSPTGLLVSSHQRGDFFTKFSINLDDWQSNFTIPLLDRTTLDDLIYQYKYDKRNRLIEKKLPGKDWEYIVYDKIDRPILTQDPNLRTSNKWMFIKYDIFNRPAYTGEYINTIKKTRSEIQLLADLGGTGLSEARTAANTLNGAPIYYSNFAFPNATDITVLTINYYDDYNFDLNGGASSTSYGIAPVTNAKSMITGSKIRILATPNWITNTYYYDAKDRPIYSYSRNDFLVTTSSIKKQFDFAGKMLSSTTTHLKNGITTTVSDSFTYDDAGRLLKQTQVINGTGTPEIILTNNYDELGQLISKKVGGKTNIGLQNIDYSYNIRGWLKTLNNPKDLIQGNTDLFGYELFYNTVSNPKYNNKPLYNGNISGILWKTIASNTKQYNYTYDALNRLKAANYDESSIIRNKFNERIDTYDRNGNIMNLTRDFPTPNIGNGYSAIDVLNYTYNNGNRLTKVDDYIKNSAYGNEGFKDGSNTDDDYSYDDNGNLILDKNKGITAIVYNHLNLPAKITFGNGTIEYIYDATGVKQRKIVSTGITTDYAGGFQYENNSLKFFQQPEGFVEYSSGVFRYIYQYKDYLGNVRLSYSDSNNDGIIVSSEILEENNYYPFGMKHKDNAIVNSTSPGLKYKFNGKELQDDNIGGNQLNLYDYGARNYDPALGRWMNIDPLAEMTRRFSPYVYAQDNPVFFIDPDGMYAVGADGLTNEQWVEASRPDADKNLAKQYRFENIKNNGKTTATAGELEDADLWRTLNKESFVGIANQLGVTQEGTISKLFEAVMLEWMTTNGADYSFQPNSEPFANGSSPDGTASPVKIEGRSVSVSLRSSLYDAKLIKDGGEVEYKPQAKNFINYLAESGQEIKTLTYVTSHGVSINHKVIKYAKARNVELRLIYSTYRINNNNFEISFYHTDGQSRIFDAVRSVPVILNVRSLMKKWGPYLNN